MHSFLLITLLIHFYITCIIAGVNIKTHGVPWMCNLNPSQYKIQPLSPNDQLLINKLEQVQIFHRHGARIGSRAITDIFPKATNLEYECNITSIENRQYENKYFTNIRKIYVKNEQIIEGNCHFRQSIKYLIPQFIANANILSNAYIGNKSYHIFNKSILQNIVSNISKYSTDSRISLQTTDYERTIASQTFLISQLFSNAVKRLENLTSITINTNVHDTTSDPYQPDDNEICINKNEYKQWIDMIKNDNKLKNTAPDNILNSEFGNKTISSFLAENGNWISGKTGKYLIYPYCAGITLPLSNKTFWNTVKLSYEWESLFKTSLNNTYAKNINLCIDHFNAIPMLNIILKHINLKTKLIFHSIHDGTIEMLLKVFNIWDGKLIIFGEMITLEIYSKINNINEYYFRIIRKGKFIPYPLCNYNNYETELCDLNILLTNVFNDIVSQKEWSNNICSNLLSNCQCGYCYDYMNTTPWNDPCLDNNNNNNDINLMSITFWSGISIGIIIGVFIIVILVIIKKRVCHREEKIHANYFLSESNM